MKMHTNIYRFLSNHPFFIIMIGTFLISDGSYLNAKQSFKNHGPDIIFVQIPESESNSANSDIINRYSVKSRIMRLSLRNKDQSPVSLTHDFYAACDPSVSFDGKSILFSGRKIKSDPWYIYQMRTDGSEKTKISKSAFDSVSPLHIGTLFYLNDTAPVDQIAYVRRSSNPLVPSSFYASNTDGTKPRGITFNLYSDTEPDVMPNGRLVFSSQKTNEGNLSQIRKRLMAVNIDGTDLMPFTGPANPLAHQKMARVGYNKRVYYIESDAAHDLDGGLLVSVSIYRSLHTRKEHSTVSDGYFHSPCPMPDGNVYISHKEKTNRSLYSIYRFDSKTNKRMEAVFRSPGYHCVDTQILAPRTHARGRSSVVGFKHKDTGVFFCMDVYNSDRPEVKKLKRGSVHQVLVTEGIYNGRPDRLQEKILGQAPVEEDGSFHIRIPSETPVTFRLLDINGNPLVQQSSWIWVMHGESRGCVGCHEDRELSPPNRQITSVLREPDLLTPAHEERKFYENGDSESGGDQ